MWIGPLWVGIALAATTALGVVGFTRYQEATGAVETLPTRLYQTVQLFVLESGAVSGPVPWELHVARFAAPIVAAYAVVRAVVLLFRDQVDLLRLRLVRGHLVVAGLGRMGSQLALAALRRSEKVVVIEADAGNRALGTLRAMGGLVVIGDGRDPSTLNRARVGQARQLAVLCGGDATNIEIVGRAREAAGDHRPGSLHCVVHVADPELALMLCATELERYGEAPVRVDFINVHAVAVQALLRAHPPFEDTDVKGPCVAVVGGGPTARHLLPALAQAWATVSSSNGRRLALGVCGQDGGTLAGLERRHPEVARLAEIRVAANLAGIADMRPRVVYVCPDDDEDATTSALDLRNRLAGRSGTIVVVLEQRSGLGLLLEQARWPASGPSVATFGLLDDACEPDVLLAGTNEVLARAMHGAYLDAARGSERPDDPALRPWPELPETLRESNRDQAAHVGVKLAAVGQAIGPLFDWTASQQPFCERDVETMARLEHARWVDERRRAGWSPGPRDPGRRTTPYLVPWEELSEDVRDQDRLFVRRLPELLATVGLQAFRLEDAGTPRLEAAEVRDDGAG